MMNDFQRNLRACKKACKAAHLLWTGLSGSVKREREVGTAQCVKDQQLQEVCQHSQGGPNWASRGDRTPEQYQRRNICQLRGILTTDEPRIRL